jgi:hydrogenase maturation protease
MKTFICGVGNKLKGDDGLGPYIIEQLENDPAIPEDVRVADFGISGFKCALTLSDYDRVIFVDAISLPGSEPGKPHCFELKEEQLKDLPTLGEVEVSMHETDLTKILSTASALHFYPKQVYVIGCEPEDTSVKFGLSKSVSDRVPQLIDAIHQLLAEETED